MNTANHQYKTAFFEGQASNMEWFGSWGRSPHTDGGWEPVHVDITEDGAYVVFRRRVVSKARRAAKPAARWSTYGEFHKSLVFDGKCVLVLHEGSQENLDNLPSLLSDLNDSGFVFSKKV